MSGRDKKDEEETKDRLAEHPKDVAPSTGVPVAGPKDPKRRVEDAVRTNDQMMNIDTLGALIESLRTHIKNNDFSGFSKDMGFITNPNQASLVLSEILPDSRYVNNIPYPYSVMQETAGRGFMPTGRTIGGGHENAASVWCYDTAFGHFCHTHAEELLSVVEGFNQIGNAVEVTVQDFRKAIVMATACHDLTPAGITVADAFGDYVKYDGAEGIRMARNNGSLEYYMSKNIPQSMRKDLTTGASLEGWPIMYTKVTALGHWEEKLARIFNVCESFQVRSSNDRIVAAKKCVSTMIYHYLQVITNTSTTLDGDVDTFEMKGTHVDRASERDNRGRGRGIKRHEPMGGRDDDRMDVDGDGRRRRLEGGIIRERERDRGSLGDDD